MLSLACLMAMSFSALGQAPLGDLRIETSATEPPPPNQDFGWNRDAHHPDYVAPEESAGSYHNHALFDWWKAPLKIRHNDPNDPARHVGLGHPLVGTSWRNRPLHIGWQVGGMFGDPLIEGRISQDEDLYGGYRLGWDFDHYWGTELRLGFANLDLTDTVPLPDIGTRTSRDQFWDVNLMYYPWGDARWRPFASLGIGAGDFYFKDETLQSVRETVLTFPLSIGVKYYHHNWLAWRMSVTDQWSPAAQGLSAMHNIAVTVGVEYHFGGTRVGYFPYRFGRHLW